MQGQCRVETGQGSGTQGKIEVESNIAIKVSHNPWLSAWYQVTIVVRKGKTGLLNTVED